MCLPRIEPIVTERPGARFNVSRIVSLPPSKTISTCFDLFQIKSNHFKPSSIRGTGQGTPSSIRIHHPSSTIHHPRAVAQGCATLRDFNTSREKTFLALPRATPNTLTYRLTQHKDFQNADFMPLSRLSHVAQNVT
jgi:hypothetical protein